MRVAVFNTKPYDQTFLTAANAGQFELVFFEPRLDLLTAQLAAGCQVVCAFVNDDLEQIAKTTIKNIQAFQTKRPLINECLADS
jgi:lactate dehydrogenase-like 2-hydroxyacid dehydrogenase